MARTPRWIALALAAAAACGGSARPAPVVRPVVTDAAPAPAPARRFDAAMEALLIQLEAYADAVYYTHAGIYLEEFDAPRPELPATYDVALRVAWSALTGALARWGSNLADQPEPSEIDQLAVELAEALAAAGLDYHVRIEAWSAPETADGPASYGLDVAAYRIMRETILDAGGERLRALDLRELRPRYYYDAFGMFDSFALVFLDAIDSKVERVGAVLEDGAGFPLAPDAWADGATGAALAKIAGAAVRRELRAVVGRDRVPAARLAALWADTVRFHEARHALDARRGGLATPAAVRDHLTVLGREADEEMATAQLSAFLGELAADHPLTQLTVWSIARHAFWDDVTAEGVAAVVVIEELAREVGAAVEPAVAGGRIDRDRLAATARALAGRSAAELRTGAARAWAAVFGSPFVPIVISP